MRFRWERSGLTEARFDATVCAVDDRGGELLAVGDVDEPIFYRSAIKLVQATAAVEAGARLRPEQLAIACASHSGLPIHIALVEDILAEHGLDRSALQTPAGWPIDDAARDLLVGRGIRSPHPVYHNCSGKHASWLAACTVAGWPIDRYLDPDHPLQRRIADLVAETTGIDPRPVGVDGCGAPVLRGSTRGLAIAFARITSWPRFHAVADATHRFSSLVADGHRPDGLLARWWGGPVKGGAAGCIGIGRNGIGIAAKTFSARADVAVAAAIEGARRLGMLSPAMVEGTQVSAAPALLGGGRAVGSLTM